MTVGQSTSTDLEKLVVLNNILIEIYIHLRGKLILAQVCNLRKQECQRKGQYRDFKNNVTHCTTSKLAAHIGCKRSSKG